MAPAAVRGLTGSRMFWDGRGQPGKANVNGLKTPKTGWTNCTMCNYTLKNRLKGRLAIQMRPGLPQVVAKKAEKRNRWENSFSAVFVTLNR
jgi:hypothetical protein